MLHRVYRYVGPPEMAAAAAGDGGRVVRSAKDLGSAEAIFTYVVDVTGVLRVADRRSEHVACARGLPVLAAGELAVSRGRVVSVSNLSTGYCPEPACFAALARALDAAVVARPEALDGRYEMRRCTACAMRNVIKDGDATCATCGAALPDAWNFDAARWRRGWVGAWIVDVLEAPGERDEDRLACVVDGGALTLAVVDGAGGTGRGRAAADALVALVARAPATPATTLLADGAALLAPLGGECAAVIARVALGDVLKIDGASAGDCRLWARDAHGWREATDAQRRKPLLGSGAVPTPFTARADALLAVTDGLGAYASHDALTAAVDGAPDTLGHALLAQVALRSGALRDDVAAIAVHRTR